MKTPEPLFSKFCIAETHIKPEGGAITRSELRQAIEQFLELVHSEEIKLGDLLAHYRELFPGEHQELIKELSAKHRKKVSYLNSLLSVASNFPIGERLPELDINHYQDIQSLDPESRIGVANKIRERVSSGGKATTLEVREMKREAQDRVRDMH